ncbi:MAG: antibiotic biosynthesis monooxygenase [Cellvibrionaceae bacterium]
MSIRVTLNCSLKAEKTTALLSFLKENLPNVRSFDGCLYVDVLFDIDQKEMLLEEQWESIQYHQHYIEFISKNGVLSELSDFFKAPPQIKYFEKSDL